MSSDRPFRKAFSFEFAGQTIRTAAKSQFDPTVVEAFSTRIDAIVALLRETQRGPALALPDIQRLDRAA